MSSGPSVGEESKFKTLLIVVVTIIALILLVARPFIADQETNRDQEANRDQPNATDDDPASKDEVSRNNEKADKGKSENENRKSTGKKSASTSETVSAENGKSNKSSKLKSDRASSKPATKNRTRGPPAKTEKKSPDPLTKVSKDVYRSNAGLIYGPGSRDKTRLAHVMRHAEDDLSKPVHGVFDGDRNEILQLIDQAYERIKKKDKTVSESKSGGRTAYSVYFAKRIGYVGGKNGKRKRNPIAKTLVLVLEKNRVITAYPK